MPRFYSLDLRKKVIDYLQKGGAVGRAVEVFGICQDTVYRWKRQFKKQGNINPKVAVHKGYKHNHEDIRDFILSHSDWTLVELAQHFGVVPTVVRRICLKFQITRKKRLYPIKKQI